MLETGFVNIFLVDLLFSRSKVRGDGGKSCFGYSSQKLSSRVVGKAGRSRFDRRTCTTTTRRCSSALDAKANHLIFFVIVIIIAAFILTPGQAYHELLSLL